MKKHIINLLILFVVYGCYAMELDPFDRAIEYDYKCRLVAKYLYKYPQGKTEQEAKDIERFLKDDISERVTVLPWLVKKYKNILATQDAQECLHNIYTYQEIYKGEDPQETRKISQDLRQEIFAQALWCSAQEYYVTHNSLKFLEIYQPTGIPRYSSSAIERFYKPYFLAELNGKDVRMHFSNLDNNWPEDTITFSTASLVDAIGKEVSRRQSVYQCKRKFIEELLSFLDKKDERVYDFHMMFNNYIEQLSKWSTQEDGVNGFIFLLERFKGLTKHITYLYTGRDRLT